MSIWIFQTLINLLFFYWLVNSLRMKQQIADLKERVECLEERFSEGLVTQHDREPTPEPEEKAGIQEKNLAPSEDTLVGARTVSEREVLEDESSTFEDLYREASRRLGRGENMELVAKDLGLSLSELRLLKRISGNSSEISAT